MKIRNEEEIALDAIRKKLVGKTLTYEEIYAVMDEIAHKRFSATLTTYFAASGYSKGFTNDELYFLTRAMVETGDKLKFRGIVADKHSIGGVPGTRTTLIVIPIVAAAGFTIPKSSSRAITTPDGTADDMEVLAQVSFSKEELYEIVEKVGACIVWGGSFNIAPADDLLIQVEKPLMFESYDKILVSIMAKKIAFGSNHIVIDLPFGPTVKIHRLEDAHILKEKFEYLARRFEVKLRAVVHEINQPAGRGIGPVLECREALKVLEQTPDRPLDLEEHAVTLASELLDLCLLDSSKSMQDQFKKKYTSSRLWAQDLLKNGMALQKMRQIIEAQKGNPNISSEKLKPGKHSYQVKTPHATKIISIDNNHITLIAKILGAPSQKGSGIYFDKKIGEEAAKNDTLFTLYSESEYNLKEAIDSLKNFPVIKT